MPENPATKPADEDEIKARFAGIERDSEPPKTALPPVPTVNIERPKAGAAGGLNYDAKGNNGVPGMRMMGGGEMRSSGAALTVGTGLVGSIIVGTGLGWLADKYLLHSTGTPWGLIVGFLVGVASGFVNLIRVTSQINR